MELNDISYQVSYRNIRYPRLEFRTGDLLMVLPHGMKPKPVMEKHKRWILNKAAFIDECLSEASEKELILRTDNEFINLVMKNVQKYAEHLGVEFNKVRFRKMKTKWASCSSSGNLSFNKLMSYLPDMLIKYISFHEVAHFIEKKHNKNFWRLVEQEFGLYTAFEKDLLSYWILINKQFNSYQKI